MKRRSTILLAAGLVALSACGGGEQNVAANAAADEALNVAPDDLGDANLLGDEALGNDLLVDDTVTNDAVDNAVTDNVTNSY